MDLCGHRGFAGPSACILEEGHDGKHKYGDIGLAYEVEVRKDAERYRWLRSGKASVEQVRSILNDTPHGIDTAIDAELRK